MAIFTSAAVAAFFAVEASFFTAATAFVLNAAVVGLASIGVSYAQKAIAGHQDQPAGATDSFAVQGKIAGGGEVPRSFNVGYSVTPGSLTWFNEHGGDTTTPNAYLTQVITLADLPSGPLQEFWVNGERCTLPGGGLVGGAQGDDAGYAVPEYIKQRGDAGEGVPHLYLKYYDGTQTAADPYLVGTAASDDRPYQSTRIGVGVAYAVVTALVNDKLWSGVPEFKFVLAVRLYDPSKDDSVGGDGDQRYDNPASWGGDGDHYPAVQTYNILRGFSYNGVWLYGLQNTSAARLPAANWITQIEKCRAAVDGADGPEPTYRSGMQINVDSQPVNAIQALLTACQGKVSSIGGFYKLRVGAPDSPTFSFTDNDIVSIEPQSFRPFFALADSINGIQARYPDPAQGWQYDTAPAYYRTDLEAKDGNRRLMASPAFDAVPYPAQVQRLQRSAIEEAQRARGHGLVLPPWYWTVEPGDVGEWTSARNFYVTKQFRVDKAIHKYNLDNWLGLTEVDPADFDPPAYIPVTTGPTVAVRPAAQGVIDWDVEEWELPDSSGIGRKPAIRITWDGTLPGIVGIKFQVRLAEDESAVTDGTSPPEISGVGALIVSQSLLPEEDYQVRIQYLPSAPRDMTWSDWRDVTTPDVRLSSKDIDDAIRYNISTLQGQNEDRFLELEQKFATLVSLVGQQVWTDTKSVRSQLSSRSDKAFAEITRVQEVSTSADAALASDIETLQATVGDNTARIEINATAFADLNGAFGSFSADITAKLGTGFSSVSTVALAVATLTGYAAEYTVSVDVNHYIIGTKLINGGLGLSKFVVVADKIQFQHPSVNGGTPVDLLTIGTAGGVASMVFAGNFTADGYVLARMIASNEVKTVHLDSQVVTAAKVKTGDLTSASGVFGTLGVKSLSIGDNAVTVPFIQTLASDFTGTGTGSTIFSFNLSIDTTGLSGKDIYIEVLCYCTTTFSAVNIAHAAAVFINSGNVQGMSFTSGQWFIICGSLKITATGAVQSVPVSMTWNSPNTGKIVTGSNCFAIAAIR